MKTFAFSLQSVLTLRKIQQEKALEVYAQAVNRSMELHHELMCALERQDYLAVLIQEQRENNLSAALQQAYAEALEEAETTCHTLQRDAEQAEAVKAERLQEFMQAKQKTEVILKLRDKEETEFIQEELRKEEKEIEDIALSRANRASLAM